MRAVKFLTTDDAQVWVNPDHIASILDCGVAANQRTTQVMFSAGNHIYVRGAAWHIAKKITGDDHSAIVYASPFVQRGDAQPGDRASDDSGEGAA